MPETAVTVSSLLASPLGASALLPRDLLWVTCALLGGRSAGRQRAGDLGAPPVRGRAQRSGLRAEAAGDGAGARDGRGLDALCQFQQESWLLLEGQVLSPGCEVRPRGTGRYEGAHNQDQSEVELFLRVKCTLVCPGFFPWYLCFLLLAYTR